MASQVMRITLKAYDHQLVDVSAKKIIETVKKNGSQVSGPLLHIHWVTLHHVAYKASYDCEPVIAGLGSVLFVFLKVVQELKDVVFRDFLESQFVYRGVRML